MFAKFSMEGTEILISCDRVTQHEIEASPGEIMVVVERDGVSVFEIKRRKNLDLFIMNNDGKTIDRVCFTK